MIKTIHRNILNATNHIIVHQVNCQGVMRSGLSGEIKDKYPHVFDAYKKYVDSFHDKKALLGKVQLVQVDENKYICNLFGQLHYGRDKNIIYTDYEALIEGLNEVYKIATEKDITVAIPHKIGCGLGNGDWTYINSAINTIFTNKGHAIYKIEVDEDLDTLTTCCFTGHRPGAKGLDYDWTTKKSLKIAYALKNEIVNLIEHEKVNHFITEGALGIDQLAFQIVKKLKKTSYPQIKLTLIIPFNSQYIKWSNKDFEMWLSQIDYADEAVYVDELKRPWYGYNKGIAIGDYSALKMQKEMSTWSMHLTMLSPFLTGQKAGLKIVMIMQSL